MIIKYAFDESGGSTYTVLQYVTLSVWICSVDSESFTQFMPGAVHVYGRDFKNVEFYEWIFRLCGINGGLWR